MRMIAGTLNSVELVGWVGNETELKNLSKGSKVCSFNVATKRRTGNATTGYGYESEWMGIEAWDKLAETCSKTITKGSRVLVRGSLMTQSWEDKTTGQKRFKTIVRATDCAVLRANEQAEDDDEGEE
jgi:single-strand DNA-binding protein